MSVEVIVIFMSSAERDWYLYHVSDKTWDDFALDDEAKGGCYDVFYLLLDAINGGRVRPIFIERFQ